MKTNKNIALLVLGILSTVGCNRFIEEATNNASNVGTNGQIPQNLKIGVQVKSGSTLIYNSKSTLDASFSAKQGDTLSIAAAVDGSLCPPGASMNVEIRDQWVDNSVVGSFAGVGCQASGSVLIKRAGPHTITVKVKVGTQEASNAFVANASCASPTFTADTVAARAGNISVSGSYGALSYSAAGVASSGLNGQAPYRCAFDFNGDDIVDSPLLPCDQAQTNKLSSYVESRKINVIVADACNTAYSVSKNIVLPKTSPSTEDVYIQGYVNPVSGSADNIRVKGVSYLGHNTAGKNICDPKYGNGAFSIECYQNYGLPHSENFGMKISVSGLGNYDIKANPGTIDFSNAKVSGISYFTDEGGDASPRLSLSGSTCTSSVQAKVVNVKNGTCSSGQSGTNNSATINVWGTYKCTNVTNGTGAATIEGSFAGMYNLGDGCSGGQGGPGDPDPNF